MGTTPGRRDWSCDERPGGGAGAVRRPKPGLGARAWTKLKRLAEARERMERILEGGAGKQSPAGRP